MARKKTVPHPTLKPMNVGAAALDIGSTMHMAAVTIGRSDTALEAFYRRLAARAGKAKAGTATARKIAVLFYNTLRYGMTYKDPSASLYEERYRSRALENLQRRAKAFGFVLTEVPDQGEMAVS